MEGHKEQGMGMKGSDEDGNGRAAALPHTMGGPHAAHGCIFPLTLLPTTPQGSVGSVVLGYLQVQTHAVGKGLVYILLALNQSHLDLIIKSSISPNYRSPPLVSIIPLGPWCFLEHVDDFCTPKSAWGLQ